MKQHANPLQTKSAQGFEEVSTSGRTTEPVLRRLAVYLAAALLAVSILYVAGRSLRPGPGGDATTFYFGTRLLLRGDNPYDPSVLHAEWEKSQLSGNTRAAPTPFINPPSMSLLVAPIAPFSFATAMFLYGLLSLACLFGSVFLLDRMFLAGSNESLRQ